MSKRPDLRQVTMPLSTYKEDIESGRTSGFFQAISALLELHRALEGKSKEQTKALVNKFVRDNGMFHDDVRTLLGLGKEEE